MIMEGISYIRKPIGLTEAVSAIEDICRNADAHAQGGVPIPPYLLELSSGNGQSVFLRYVTNMFKAHRVRHFGGLDSCLEFVTDGSMAQLQDMFAHIQASSVYTNNYEGVIAIDITALANVVNEKQMFCFLSQIHRVAKHATLILYVSSDSVRSRDKIDALIGKVSAAFHNKLQILPVKPYTHEEFARMVLCNIDDRGIMVEDDGDFLETLRHIVAAKLPQVARETEDLTNEIVKQADYSHLLATIDTNRLRAAFPDVFVAERGNQNAK